ncbi:CYFA0S13e03224g1_1 [Cyberlindnera fabianii]|uniref:CYFA0S13e03224g1_1 n=1 Tax=Cyberlindnera fabianii TaxID=36022 RepID=A0A061BAY2_CYBFA|nr:CYFA0S13e03224g1_1 [Cyberlindnera fabianii]
MPAASTLGYAGWAFFGVIVRGFQLGVLNRPFSSGKMGYVYSAGFWTGFGYLFYQMVDKNDEIIEGRVKQLKESRAARAAATANSAE